MAGNVERKEGDHDTLTLDGRTRQGLRAENGVDAGLARRAPAVYVRSVRTDVRAEDGFARPLATSLKKR
jgi:hypothetical protein